MGKGKRENGVGKREKGLRDGTKCQNSETAKQRQESWVAKRPRDLQLLINNYPGQMVGFCCLGRQLFQNKPFNFILQGKWGNILFDSHSGLVPLFRCSAVSLNEHFESNQHNLWFWVAFKGQGEGPNAKTAKQRNGGRRVGVFGLLNCLTTGDTGKLFGAGISVFPDMDMKHIIMDTSSIS